MSTVALPEQAYVLNDTPDVGPFNGKIKNKMGPDAVARFAKYRGVESERIY